MPRAQAHSTCEILHADLADFRDGGLFEKNMGRGVGELVFM